MKVLFVDMRGGLAGHTRTATTTAQALERRGHSVSFAVSEGSITRVIEDAGLKIRPVPAGWAGRYPALERLIHNLHAHGEVDVVHTFDKRGLPEAARAAKALGIPVFQTICGGVPPREVLETKPVVSLSYEIKQALLERTALQDDEIEVIPARLDFTALRSRAAENGGPTYSRFREKYDLPGTSKIVLRIARLSNKYREGILQSADAVARLHEEGYDVRFVHIGVVPPDGDKNLEEVSAHFGELNRVAGEVVAVTVQDEAPHAPDYLGLADIVVGMGRTAFEGMLLKKPVLVVGNKGFAGLVGRADTERFAIYNFSGRHLEETKPYERSVTELTDALRELLGDEALRTRLGEFGHAYVLENLDVNAAARRYEALYRSFSPADYPSDEQLAAYLKLTPKRVLRGLIPKKMHDYYRKLRYPLK